MPPLRGGIRALVAVRLVGVVPGAAGVGVHKAVIRGAI